jgi:MFS family permease
MAEEVTVPPAAEEHSVNKLAALNPPANRVKFSFLAWLTLGNVSWLIVSVPAAALLLPLQIGILDKVHKVALLGTILALGGLCGVIIPPLCGAFSDRTTSRLGRRRPWILTGGLGVIVGLLLIALFPSVPILALGWIIADGAGNLLYATMKIVISDRVPEQQRGLASGLVGLIEPVGEVVGLIIVSIVLSRSGQSLLASCAVLLAFLVVAGGGFVLFYREPQLPGGIMPPFRLKELVRDFWINPRVYPDFAYAWVTRFLIFLSFFSVSSFILYYLSDIVHYTQIFPGRTAADGVTLVTSISTVCAAVAALLSGLVSDRIQSRKFLVIGAGVLIAAGLFTLALLHSWLAVVVATILQGTGFGIFVVVDLVLVIQVLPHAETRGRDLGVMVMALNLARFIAPAAGAMIVSIFGANVVAGYSALYLVAACLTLLAIVLVLPIKGVR